MSEFKVALESNGLFDLGLQGMKYMWNNRHLDSTFTKFKLDRIVTTKEWIEKTWHQKVEVHSSARSDHEPILISTRKPEMIKNRKDKLFRFEASWIKHEVEEQIIQEVWARGTSPISLWKHIQIKLQQCSQALTKLSDHSRKEEKRALQEKT